MIFDSHMHVGDFPLFNVSLDRDGLAALMQETGIDTALLFSPDNELVRQIAEELPGRLGALLGQPQPAARPCARRTPSSSTRASAASSSTRCSTPTTRTTRRCTRSWRWPASAACPCSSTPAIRSSRCRGRSRRSLRTFRTPRSSSVTWDTATSSTSTPRSTSPAGARTCYLETSGMPMHTQDPGGGRARRGRARAVRLGRAVPPPGGRAAEGAAERPRAGRHRAGPGRQRSGALRHGATGSHMT